MTRTNEEIARADPVLRRRALRVAFVFALISVLGIVYVVLYGDPLDQWNHQQLLKLEQLMEADPEAGAAVVRRWWASLLAMLWLLGLSVSTLCVWSGVRMSRAERWPPIEARLIADRRVIRGRALRVLAGALIAAAVLQVGLLAYFTWRMAEWFRL